MMKYRYILIAGLGLMPLASMAQTTFTGIVFNDFEQPLKSRNAATESLIDNQALFQGGLNINLIDTVANLVIATAVVGNNGGYTMTLPGNVTDFSSYVIELSESTGTIGSPPPPPAILTTPWTFTGEGGISDVFANGRVNPVVGLINDFGIQRLPTTTPFTITTISAVLNPPVSWNLDANPLSGEDLSESGTLGTGSSFIITSNLVYTSGPDAPNMVMSSVAELVYETAPGVFSPLVVGGIITNYDPAKFFIRYNGTPTGQMKFEFRAVDEAGGIATNSGLYFIEQPILLPATGLNLWGESSNNRSTLHWRTLSEFNTTHFEIQESGGNGVFKTIGTVHAAGNRTGAASYAFVIQPKLHFPYYRIKVIDRNGAFQLSNVLYLPTGVTGEARLFPNPVSNSQFHLAIKDGGQYTVKMVDISGRVVKQQNFSISSGSMIHMDIPMGLAGLYYVVAVDAQNRVIWQESLLVK